MSDNTTAGDPTPSPDDFFGADPGNASTGANGSDGGGSTYSQYASPGDLFSNVTGNDLTSTGLNGSEPVSPPRDGSSAEVTSPFGILEGSNAPQVSGSTSTSKDSLSGLFSLGNVTSTGAGEGEAGSSHTSAADQASRWETL